MLCWNCSGVLLTRAQAEQHLQAGAGRVLVSAPGKNLDATLVYGVNEQMPQAGTPPDLECLLHNQIVSRRCAKPSTLLGALRVG